MIIIIMIMHYCSSLPSQIGWSDRVRVRTKPSLLLVLLRCDSFGFLLLNKVTVHQPICQENGDLNLALYGSFLPVPSVEIFASASANVVPLVSFVWPGWILIACVTFKTCYF